MGVEYEAGQGKTSAECWLLLNFRTSSLEGEEGSRARCRVERNPFKEESGILKAISALPFLSKTYTHTHTLSHIRTAAHVLIQVGLSVTHYLPLSLPISRQWLYTPELMNIQGHVHFLIRYVSLWPEAWFHHRICFYLYYHRPSSLIDVRILLAQVFQRLLLSVQKLSPII